MFDKHTGLTANFFTLIHTDQWYQGGGIGDGHVHMQFARGNLVFKARGLSISNSWYGWEGVFEKWILLQNGPMFFLNIFHFLILKIEGGYEPGGVVCYLFFFFGWFAFGVIIICFVR